MTITDTHIKVWKALRLFLNNVYGVAGVMGNLYAESGIQPVNLQNSYERSLGMSDQEYTEAVDSGRYTDFATDNAGYGIAQWTYHSRKQNMLAAATIMGKSIGDLDFQIYFLCRELENYSVVLAELCSAKSIYNASTAFLTKYEKPANLTDENKQRRADLSQQFYDALKDVEPDEGPYVGEFYRVLKRGSKGDDVVRLQKNLIEMGYNLPHGADGAYGSETFEAVLAYQLERNLYDDGIAGSLTQSLLSYELIEGYDPDGDDVVIDDGPVDDTPQFQPVDIEPPALYTIMIEHLEEDAAEELFKRFEDYPVILERE